MVTNYAVSLDLLKRTPDELKWNPVAPVTLDTPMSRITQPETHMPGTALVFSDLHVGYAVSRQTGEFMPTHDRRCLDVFLSVAAKLKPEQIVFVGDMLDMTEWSTKWVTSPDMMFTTQAALVETLWWLTMLRRSCPGSRIVILEGNHDARLVRSIAKNYIAAAGLRPANELNGPEIMSMERLMGLSSVDVEYIPHYPDNHFEICETLHVVHGGGGGKDPVKYLSRSLEGIRVSQISGHIHKLAKVYLTDWYGDRHSTRYAASCGCAVKIGGPLPRASRWGSYNWQNGFAYVEYTRGSNGTCQHSTDIVEIVGGSKCYFRGHEYTGVDRSGDMYDHTGYHAFKPSGR